MSDSYGPHLDPEMDKVRALQGDAMREQADRGSTREGVFEAGIRAAVQYAIDNQEPDLSNLADALGVELDAGSFLMGMQAAAMAMQGMNMVEVAKLPLGRRALRGAVDSARQRHEAFEREQEEDR